MKKTLNRSAAVYVTNAFYPVCLFVCFAVASFVDMGLRGTNICYLTQITQSEEASGAEQGNKVLQQAKEKEVTKSVLGAARVNLS